MIRYPISRKELENLIDAHNPTWRTRAATRTADLIAAGSSYESSRIWSEVKPIYMRLQGKSKCAYCERKLESEDHGLGEQGVDHFRPKGDLREWTGSTTFSIHKINQTKLTGAAGYIALVYDIYNYAAACIPCNSNLKSNFFPITGPYDFTGTKPEKMKSEKPLLVYPIGEFDSDPEELIGFYGVSPYALPKKGYSRHRALATIDFFSLDDSNRRSNLFLERGRIITALHNLLVLETAKLAGSAQRKVELAAAIAKTAPHANCARNYINLYRTDPAKAEIVYKEVVDYIDTKS